MVLIFFDFAALVALARDGLRVGHDIVQTVRPSRIIRRREQSQGFTVRRAAYLGFTIVIIVIVIIMFVFLMLVVVCQLGFSYLHRALFNVVLLLFVGVLARVLLLGSVGGLGSEQRAVWCLELIGFCVHLVTL